MDWEARKRDGPNRARNLTNRFKGVVLIGVSYFHWVVQVPCFGYLIKDYDIVPLFPWALFIQSKDRNVGSEVKWYEDCRGKFPENPKIVEFPQCEPFIRIFLKILIHLVRGYLFSFPEISQNAVPFATGNWLKFKGR